MKAEWICFIAGPVIAMLVQLFKRWAVVQQNPKIVAAILSGITSVILNTVGANDPEWQVIIQCVIVPFATAVASYEIAHSAGMAK